MHWARAQFEQHCSAPILEWQSKCDFVDLLRIQSVFFQRITPAAYCLLPLASSCCMPQHWVCLCVLVFACCFLICQTDWQQDSPTIAHYNMRRRLEDLETPISAGPTPEKGVRQQVGAVASSITLKSANVMTDIRHTKNNESLAWETLANRGRKIGFVHEKKFLKKSEQEKV